MSERPSFLFSLDSSEDGEELADMNDAHAKMDYRVFKLNKYVQAYPWLYYNVVDEGYKWKYCEMFPSIVGTVGNAASKFSTEAVKKFVRSSRTSTWNPSKFFKT